MFCNILSSMFWTHCSTECCNRTPTAETILSKMFANCARVVVSNHQQLPTDTEGLPGDFPFLSLPVQTNLLITTVMWASNDVSWICKLGYLATYSYLQTVTEYTYSFTNVSLRYEGITMKVSYSTVPFSRSSLPSTKTKLSYASTKSLENDCFLVLSLDQRQLTVIHTWKTFEQ